MTNDLHFLRKFVVWWIRFWLLLKTVWFRPYYNLRGWLDVKYLIIIYLPVSMSTCTVPHLLQILRGKHMLVALSRYGGKTGIVFSMFFSAVISWFSQRFCPTFARANHNCILGSNACTAMKNLVRGLVHCAQFQTNTFLCWLNILNRLGGNRLWFEFKWIH